MPWYYEKCIDYFSCNQFSFPICEHTPGKFKDKCEWYTPSTSRYCISKQTSAQICDENVNELDCVRSILGCYFYKDQCIIAEQCNDLKDFSVCLNNTGALKDKCEWYTPGSSRYCISKQTSAQICSENLNELDCVRSILGCKWYRNECIKAEQCNDLKDFSVCLNNTGALKDKCEWYTPSSSSYCQDKSKINYIDNCKDITYGDCQKGLNGCYWISEKCILPTQCSDFNQTICQNINSYSSFRGTCEWNEITKKCQRKGDLYGLCSNNLDENDCSRSLLGCTWVNNKCVSAHQCSLLSSSVCENLKSNTILWSTCEWNKNDKICLQKKSIRLIRNLVDDEITTKYKCSFNFPNIKEKTNFDLILVDKNNIKASISLSLDSYDSTNETSDDNKFIIYQSSGCFLKNNLLALLILILLIFMIKN